MHYKLCFIDDLHHEIHGQQDSLNQYTKQRSKHINLK